MMLADHEPAPPQQSGSTTLEIVVLPCCCGVIVVDVGAKRGDAEAIPASRPASTSMPLFQTCRGFFDGLSRLLAGRGQSVGATIAKTS